MYKGKDHVDVILKIKTEENQNPQPHAVVDLHGGAEGSRTPVRKITAHKFLRV
ncbi:hypothetical protein D3C75_830930 [compost metagenome]